MGEVIDLSSYRKRISAEHFDGYSLHAEPPVMVVRHFRNGVFVGEERVISETMLRELIELIP